MEQERKIVENLGRSEEWFCQTFKKLREVCGPALHDIDFKDYQQLHTVIKKPINCDTLLKGQQVSIKVLENLVGAAKNLHSSLMGVKWLFDVRALMEESTGAKQFSQLLSLYYRAKELQIDTGAGNREEHVENKESLAL